MAVFSVDIRLSLLSQKSAIGKTHVFFFLFFKFLKMPYEKKNIFFSQKYTVCLNSWTTFIRILKNIKFIRKVIPEINAEWTLNTLRKKNKEIAVVENFEVGFLGFKKKCYLCQQLQITIYK